jgi:hypothetical protein
METSTELFSEPVLNTQCTIPGDAFEEWIDKAGDQECCNELWVKAGTLSDASGYNSRNGSSKGQ